jgi:hypothetical protein
MSNVIPLRPTRSPRHYGTMHVKRQPDGSWAVFQMGRNDDSSSWIGEFAAGQMAAAYRAAVAELPRYAPCNLEVMGSDDDDRPSLVQLDEGGHGPWAA